MTFRERFLNGEAEFDEIFDLTDEWNFSDTTIPLREYLGLTAEEEDIWVSESDEALEEYMSRERNRKMLFVDLDGTLLHNDKSISPQMKTLLKRIVDEGHLIAITTGRALPSAVKQAKALGLDRPGCYLICYNGVQIAKADTLEIIFHREIAPEIVRLCFDEAKKDGLFIQTYTEREVLSETDAEQIRSYCKIQNLTYRIVADVTAEVPEGTPKMLIIEDDLQKVSSFRERIDSRLNRALDLFFSSVNYLEMVPAGINKGQALTSLCEQLHMPLSHVLSAGDEENDIPMLRAAGTGIAMKNAREPVKEAADRITQEDNEHDGLIPFLEEFFLS